MSEQASNVPRPILKSSTADKPYVSMQLIVMRIFNVFIGPIFVLSVPHTNPLCASFHTASLMLWFFPRCLRSERAVAPASGIVWDEDNLALNESEKVPRMTIDEPKTPYHAPGSPALSASNSPALAPTCSSTGSPAVVAATLAPAATEGCFVGELPTLDAVTAEIGRAHV